MKKTILILFLLGLAACSPAAVTALPHPTYDPFVPVTKSTPGAASVPAEAPPTLPSSTPTELPFIVPTAVPLEQLLPLPRPPGAPIYTPTPDALRVLPTPRQSVDEYVVQPGDTLGSIAFSRGVSLEALMQANGLTDPNLLEVGQTLVIPAPEPIGVSASFKIIPDSELVYGPASAAFSVEAFLQSRGGFLANYNEEVNGELLSAAQIITRVAQNYSVNPRLLIALVEHQSGWVSNPAPFQIDYALNFPDAYYTGLYLQLTFAANELNRGYYLWRVNAVSSWVLADGFVVPAAPGVNAGTAGVQNFFARLDDLAAWQVDVGDAEGSFFYTYFFLFGYPFDFATEPLIPPGLTQPRLALPFERGVTWAFTGGPHGGWDSGSAWAALDFAPIGEVQGCFTSEDWVTAATDGLIVRTGDGQVIQDLDGDGYEQTGWVIFYMHVEERDRVAPGTYVKGGERIGHPSCEGGISNGTHVHIARKYNGEWIPADGDLPFDFDGWISSGNGIEYDGWLTRGEEVREAYDGLMEVNSISR
ncbi:MAG: LysM peptidoglycan-binding domain-containing protein [Chloroflexota bacterium]